MVDNYDEINEPFKLQSHNVFVATSSESDELSANMDNYTSVTNNKMLYNKAIFLQFFKNLKSFFSSGPTLISRKRNFVSVPVKSLFI